MVVLALLKSQARPGGFTLGLTSALGLGLSVMLAILAVAGTIGRVVVLLTMWSLPFISGLMMGLVQLARSLYRMNPIALLMLLILGVLQFQIARIAQHATRATGSGKSTQWSVGRAMGFVALGVAAIISTSALSHAETTTVRTFIKKQEQQRAAGLDSYHAMLRIQACAATYADSVSKGEYPATLAAMGPGGSNCLDSAMAAGAVSGYRVQYHPTTGSSGRNVGWWAFAARHREDNALLADHTGALYVGYYQAPAKNNGDSIVNLHVPSYSDLAKWVRGARCIRDSYAQDTTRRGYAADITGTEGLCLSINRNRIVLGDYLLTYEPQQPDRTGRYRSFVLHATARHYGQEAVRSFLIDPDGVVHVTASPRPATSADPVYVGCESDQTLPCRIAGMERAGS